MFGYILKYVSSYEAAIPCKVCLYHNGIEWAYNIFCLTSTAFLNGCPTLASRRRNLKYFSIVEIIKRAILFFVLNCGIQAGKISSTTTPYLNSCSYKSILLALLNKITTPLISKINFDSWSNGLKILTKSVLTRSIMKEWDSNTWSWV